MAPTEEEIRYKQNERTSHIWTVEELCSFSLTIEKSASGLHCSVKIALGHINVHTKCYQKVPYGWRHTANSHFHIFTFLPRLSLEKWKKRHLASPLATSCIIQPVCEKNIKLFLTFSLNDHGRTNSQVDYRTYSENQPYDRPVDISAGRTISFEWTDIYKIIKWVFKLEQFGNNSSTKYFIIYVCKISYWFCTHKLCFEQKYEKISEF